MIARFSLSSLSSSKLPPGKYKNPEQRQAAPEEKNNLAYGQPQLFPGNAAAGAERINRREVFRQASDLEHCAESRNHYHVSGRPALGSLFGVIVGYSALVDSVCHRSICEDQYQN